MSDQIQLRERASYSYCARSWRQQTNPSRKQIFSAIFHFGILLLKNWLRLRQQFKLNMESCRPTDEGELPTFSLGMEFLTPQKERKEKENKATLRATPPATLTHLSCSPNFPRVSYLDERTLTYEPIVNCFPHCEESRWFEPHQAIDCSSSCLLFDVSSFSSGASASIHLIFRLNKGRYEKGVRSIKMR